MLRVYFLQQWYGLADEALEDALYDSQALRGFARIDLAAEGVSDATTLLKFRRRLETRDLCKGIFTALNADLSARGLLLREGTLVDATLIAAPSFTKNNEQQRDPEMHQTRKGNQWYFGMKAHIGVDRDSKLVHTVVVTAANVADVTQTAALLHGEETQVHADAGYLGVEKREEIVAMERTIDWQTARKRGATNKMAEGAVKTAVQAFVEHPFHIVKNLFGYRKVRCRGLAKNGHQLYTLFGLADMDRLALLPEGQGTEWHSDADSGRRIVWSFRAGPLAVPRGAQVDDVRSGRPMTVADGSFTAEPFGVYRVQEAAGGSGR